MVLPIVSSVRIIRVYAIALGNSTTPYRGMHAA